MVSQYFGVCTLVLLVLLFINLFQYLSLAKKLEVVNNRVQVCRDALSDRCSRDKCRHYHIPAEILIKHVPIHGLDNNESIETTNENAAVDESSALNRTTSNSSSAGTNGDFRSPGLEGVFQSPQLSDPHLARGDPNGSC